MKNGLITKRLLTSCFGLGWLPAAPGTFGSLPPAIIFALLCYFQLPSSLTITVMAGLVLLGAVICVLYSPAAIIATGKNDPSEVVADEFAGQAITFLAIGTLPSSQILPAALLGFLFFRLFDITKPWPIKKLEKFPLGWGILLDDVLAGIFAAIALFLCSRFGIIEYLSKFVIHKPIILLQAAALGAIQGFTEFLPVSSSGPLVLFEKIFGLKPHTAEMLLFDLTTHLGTVAAILIVLRKSILSWLKNLLKFRQYGDNPIQIYKRNPGVHFLTLAFITTVVTVAIALVFKDYFESARASLKTVAVMWLLTATLLLITDYRKKTRLGLRQLGITAAIIIGIAQAAAIMPGISRSGATICAAILIGLHRRWALEYSMLIGVVAIMGATAVEFAENYNKISAGQMPLAAFAIGAVISCLVGIVALKLLIKSSRKANLKFFAFYCYILAAFVLVYLLR